MRLTLTSMDEYFLHFLWKFQKFNSRPLLTEDGQELIVFKPGYSHDHAGPDFEEAKIKIGDIIWNGPIEIHYRSSDWFAHSHEKDERYDPIILHIVWIFDKRICYKNGKTIPSFILKDYVDQNLTDAYRHYINQTEDILCSSYKVQNISWIQLKDQAIARRLESRSIEINAIHKKVDGDWEEAAYRLLCRNMGFSVNKEPLVRLSEVLPFRILKKHANNIFQIEALIFGQAGFLEEISDEYQKNLSKEFKFLKTKYGLESQLHKTQWLFLRLRPANFPSVRLSQLAGFIHSNTNIFSWMTQLNMTDLKKPPNCTTSSYWTTHYDFGKLLKSTKNNFGLSSWQNIVINTSVPLLCAYSKHVDDQEMYAKALDLLTFMKPEENKITKSWKKLHLKIENALDSQALIYQYRSYCLKKRCLQCNIGVNILQRT